MPPPDNAVVIEQWAGGEEGGEEGEGKNSPKKEKKRFRNNPQEHLLCWLKRSSANSSSQGQTAAERSQPTARANSAYLELKSSH